jgi:thiol-disulfide isomerase/thioredoxin
LCNPSRASDTIATARRNKMTRNQLRRVSGLAAATVIPLLFLVSVAGASNVPKVGESAPRFLGIGIDGKKVSLETYSGKVIVVSFWATWCAPCRAELPILEGIQKAAKGGVQVVGINIESSDVFRRATKLMKVFTIQLTSDENHQGFNAYGVKGIPHLVVIGKDMRIISVREGYNPSELDDVAAELNAALRVGSAEGAADSTETQ